MNFLDMRTVILSYAISSLICLIVIAVLWNDHRRRYPGIGFWLADFGLQTTALLLVLLRGLVPDLLSMTGSNLMVLGGTLLLFIGLQRFTGRASAQLHNLLLLAAFTGLHAYFVLVEPSLQARNILLSLGLLALCAQCAWLLLRRVDAWLRPVTASTGYIMLVFCAFSLARIAYALAVPAGTDLFQSDSFETLVILSYQMLYLMLTLTLFLMVDRRLVLELEQDVRARMQVEAALRQSEEKFFTAFQSSPDAVMISRLSDGKFIEVNEGFCRMSGYTREEALAGTSLSLGLWPDPRSRERLVAEVLANRRIREKEMDIRMRTGEIRHCLVSAEVVPLSGEPHLVSVVNDITRRKELETELRRLVALEERQRMARDLHDSVNQSIHSLVLFSETLSAALAKSHLERANEIAARLVDSARQAQRELRLMLFQLQPSTVGEQIDLVRDLEARLATVERRSGIDARIVLDGASENCPPDWRANLFWLAIEALNNSLKHARARHVRIDLRFLPHRLELEVTDDGIGFDPQHYGYGGLGLRSMAERARELGGELAITSAPGQGTSVHLTADLEA